MANLIYVYCIFEPIARVISKLLRTFKWTIVIPPES